MPWNPEHYNRKNMKTTEVMKILEENKITNILPTKEVFVVKNSRTNKIIC